MYGKGRSKSPLRERVIHGEGINSFPYKFIILVSIIIVMGTLYFLEKYNCGPWLFGLAFFFAYIFAPKTIQQKYKYVFVMSVQGETEALEVVLPLSSINVNNINVGYEILTCSCGVGHLSIKEQIVKVFLKLGEETIGAFTLGPKCFSITQSDKEGIYTTVSKIKGDIYVKCGVKTWQINKPSLQIVKTQFI